MSSQQKAGLYPFNSGNGRPPGHDLNELMRPRQRTEAGERFVS